MQQIDIRTYDADHVHDYSIRNKDNHFSYINSFRWYTNPTGLDQPIKVDEQCFSPKVHSLPDKFVRDRRHQFLNSSVAFPKKICVEGFYNNTPHYYGVKLTAKDKKSLDAFNSIPFQSSSPFDSVGGKKGKKSPGNNNNNETERFLYVIKPHSNVSFSEGKTLYEGEGVINSTLAELTSQESIKKMLSSTVKTDSGTRHSRVHRDSVLFGAVINTGSVPRNSKGDYTINLDDQYMTITDEVLKDAIQYLKKDIRKYVPRLNLKDLYVEIIKLEEVSDDDEYGYGTGNINGPSDDTDKTEPGSSQRSQVSIDLSFSLAFCLPYDD
jgi:hypothetical protein